MTPVARFLDRSVWAYQKLTEGRISPCRYVPSCSTYAREAVGHHGAARGSWLALRRLVRCAPWGGHGYDPVPGTGPTGAALPPLSSAPSTPATTDAGPSAPSTRCC